MYDTSAARWLQQGGQIFQNHVLFLATYSSELQQEGRVGGATHRQGPRHSPLHKLSPCSAPGRPRSLFDRINQRVPQPRLSSHAWPSQRWDSSVMGQQCDETPSSCSH